MSYKLGILLPIKSILAWKNIYDSFLYKILIKSFLKTHDTEHKYTFYCIFDQCDHIYGNKEEQNKLKNIVNIQFINSDGIEKGHLTSMWNRAFEKAYQDKCDYFFQCGDDTELCNEGWVNASIKELQKNNNIGLTGPIDKLRWLSCSNSRIGGDRFIMTQSFVSRKHYEIFGFYFPEELKNWYCDNFITNLYFPKYFYYIDYFIINKGGKPRYEINGSLNTNCKVKKICEKLVNNYKVKLISHEDDTIL